MNGKKFHFQGFQKGNKVLSMQLSINLRLLKKPAEEADLKISTLNKTYAAMDSQSPLEVEAKTELWEAVFLSLLLII